MALPSEILIFGCGLDKALPSTSNIPKHRIISVVTKFWDPSFSDNQPVWKIRSQKRYEFLINSVVWWILPARTRVETIFSARIYDALTSSQAGPLQCKSELGIPHNMHCRIAWALRLNLSSDFKSFFYKVLKHCPLKNIMREIFILISSYFALFCIFVRASQIRNMDMYVGNIFFLIGTWV